MILEKIIQLELPFNDVECKEFIEVNKYEINILQQIKKENREVFINNYGAMIRKHYCEDLCHNYKHCDLKLYE